MDNIITTPEQISAYQLRAQISAIKLEGKGFRFKGGSVLAHCKRAYNLKGSRETVLAAMEKISAEAIAKI